MKPNIFEPSSGLKKYVQCYWTLEGLLEDTPKINTIIPDGSMKLIFHYGETYRHHPPNGAPLVLPKCFLIGQLTRPYIVEPLGDTGTFVVRFHPSGFLPFSALPVKVMENTAVPIEQLFQEEGKYLGENILKAGSTQERIQIIEAFLLARLADTSHLDDIIWLTVQKILEESGQFTVDELSKVSSVSRRQLVRKFSSIIGLSPKQLSKTIRVQAALKKLLNHKADSLTGLAYDSGYFDQAHFIKEFKEFTGLTPKQFYGDNLKMSLIFDKPA